MFKEKLKSMVQENQELTKDNFSVIKDSEAYELLGGCARLRECGEFSGSCSRLKSCGTFVEQ